MWSRQGEEASKNESHVHQHKKRRAAPFGSSPSIVEPRSLWTASSVASRRCPRKRQASRSCEPATAAEDNETPAEAFPPSNDPKQLITPNIKNFLENKPTQPKID